MKKKRKISLFLTAMIFTGLFGSTVPVLKYNVQAIELPAEFSNSDIGAATGGSTVFDSEKGEFTVTGSGSDISKDATGTDNLHFAYMEVSGDFTFEAMIRNIDPIIAKNFKVGLMIRDSVDESSNYIANLVQGNKQTPVGYQPRAMYRGIVDSALKGSGSNVGTLVSELPINLKLEKVGDLYTSYINGVSVKSQTVSISSDEKVLAGLAVCSNDASNTIAATFANVKITGADGNVIYSSVPELPADKQIKELKPLEDVVVTQGESIVLPQTVQAVYMDEHEAAIDIEWLTTVDNSVIGETIAKGIIRTYTGELVDVEVKVIVKASEVPITIVSVNPLSDIKAIIGEKIELPATATVTYSNTITDTVPIDWEGQTIDTSNAGEKTYYGKIEGYSEGISVKVIVSAQKFYTVADVMGQDVGSVAVPGTLTFNETTKQFKLTSQSNGVQKTADGLDQFFFATLKMKGNFTISAKVVEFNGVSGKSHAGLAIRKSLDSNSYHVTQVWELGSGGRNLYRYNGNSNGSTIKRIMNGAYIELTKEGDKVTSKIASLDDLNNPIVSVSEAKNLSIDANGIEDEVYVGFLLSSNNAKVVDATFEDIRIVMEDGTVVFDSFEGKPIPPRNVQARSLSQSGILTWDDHRTADSYIVKQATSPEGPFTPINVDIVKEDGKVKVTINGLENDKTYYYQVTATNSYGEGPASEVVTLTPSIEAITPPVVTLTSSELSGEVFNAVANFAGYVDKDSTILVLNNGTPLKLSGEETSIAVKKNEKFNFNIILTQGSNALELVVTDTYGNVTTKQFNVTYTYKIANIKFHDLNGNLVTSLNPSQQIVVSAEVENYINTSKDSVLVVALYDAKNNVIKSVLTSESLTYGETDVFSVSFKLPEDVTGYTLKAFVWNNVTDIHPISDVMILK